MRHLLCILLLCSCVVPCFGRAKIGSACYTPALSPAPGTFGATQTVTITDATVGATIRITLDGSTPTSSSTIYTAPLTVSSTTTVKALAFATRYSQSKLAGGLYTIAVPVAAAPAFAPAPGTYTTGQSVTLGSGTPGATIYYTTDGSTPTTGSTAYTGAISVGATATVKALAVAAGYTNSAVSSGTYTITPTPTVATPTFSPAAGTYTAAQSVTISTSTVGDTIYYTTDGSSPTTGSTVYTGPITVSTTETVKAIGVAAGYINSAVGSAAYTISISTATQLFGSNFGGATAIGSATCGSTYCNQPLSGTDSTTGYTWPAAIWNSSVLALPNSIFTQTYGANAYLYQPATIQTVSGPTGSPTTALKLANNCSVASGVYSGVVCGSAGHTWGDGPMLMLSPDTGAAQDTFYYRYWVMFQPDLATNLITGNWSDAKAGDWRTVMEWKTGTSANHSSTPCVPTTVQNNNYGGDLRIELNIKRPSSGPLYWQAVMDSNANGIPVTTFWTITNNTVAVPVGTWALMEYYLHRASDSTGRSWAAINGHVIYDYRGWTINQAGSGHGGYGCKINRLVPFEVYASATPPSAYEWVTGFELWDDFPSDATAH